MDLAKWMSPRYVQYIHGEEKRGDFSGRDWLKLDKKVLKNKYTNVFLC